MALTLSEFWRKIEINTGCSLPIHLQNILRLNGYDDAMSIQSLTIDDIDSLEKFAREEMKDFIGPSDDPKDFYNIFHEKREKFKIMKGDRVKLMIIVQFVQKKLASEGGAQFFLNDQFSQLPVQETMQENISRTVQSTDSSTLITSKGEHNTSLALLEKPITSLAVLEEITHQLRNHIEIFESYSTFLFDLLVETAYKNRLKKKNGYRYDTIIIMFASYLKMVAGLLAYETLHANLAFCLPAPSTVDKYLQESGPRIVEGRFRFKELKDFLIARNLPLPLRIYLSEDATRITPKVTYDSTTNQLIGFVLPLNENGMPIPLSFPARSAKEIEGHFANASNVLANYAYTVMAQPIIPNASSFCLSAYSTDSKFQANDVINRWKATKTELKEYDIILDGISSDGDPKLLKSMKVVSGIGITNKKFLNCDWYSCGGLSDDEFENTVYIQDTDHILTKSRNRILKKSRLTPLGNYVISIGHVIYLIRNVSKDKHLLNWSDVDPKDRQNTRSAEKICSLRTIECLLKYVPGSESTAMYLKVMNLATNAYIDQNISAKERVYWIWFSVFILRIWRSWILNTNHFNLKENFISNNCYTCIELNAHSLVKQIIKAKSSPHQTQCSFIPKIYSSQPCESTFRQLRSMTTTYATVVNFGMLDFVCRIKRIQLQADIIQSCTGRIIFPRFDQKRKADIKATPNHALPNKEEIIMEIERAKIDATLEAKNLGIDMKNINFYCQVKYSAKSQRGEFQTNSNRERNSNDSDFEESASSDEETNEEIDSSETYPLEAQIDEIQDDWEELGTDEQTLLGITGDIELRDYSKSNQDWKENSLEDSRVALIADSSGKEKIVLKSTICWLLQQNKYKLSADRLQRVQESDYGKANQKGSAKNEQSSETEPFINNEIHIGDWCVFSYEYTNKYNHLQESNTSEALSGADKKPIEKTTKVLNKTRCVTSSRKSCKTTNEVSPKVSKARSKAKTTRRKKNRRSQEIQGTTKKTILIGLVLSFCFIHGKSFKSRNYFRNFAIVELKNEGNEREIGVLCSWFKLKETGTLTTYNTIEHKFVSIRNYKGTIKTPLYKNESLQLSKCLTKEILKMQGKS